MTSQSRKSSSLNQVQILNVSAPSNSATTGIVTILFATVDSSLELAAYSANYAAGTGIYTVPAGGHKNVKIKTEIKTTAPGATATQLDILINGTSKANITTSAIAGNYCNKLEYNLRNLVAGDTVKIQAGISASACCSGGTFESFQMFATS